MRSQITTMNDEPNLPCPHGRDSWKSCPHCLGVNTPRGEKEYIASIQKNLENLGEFTNNFVHMPPQNKENIREEFLSEYAGSKGYHPKLNMEIADWFLSRTIPRELLKEEIEKMKDIQLANAEGLMDDETRAGKFQAIVINKIVDHILSLISAKK